ncbi:YraN family protein [Pelagibius sp.]|uniref:YraN family protein n=1 Tax=Pelagibius sp. TaxID=1931238 RepID=UPI00261462E1|nr:YraN family protein [Pelagibius sp.]
MTGGPVPPQAAPPRSRQAAYRRGRRAERLAGWWLRLKGYRLLVRGFRCPAGEIDLIAKRGGTLVFVEVKQRDTVAMAAAAVSPRQRRRIARAAEAFLQARPDLAALTLRFDAVLLARHFWRRPAWPLQHEKDAWRSDTRLPY